MLHNRKAGFLILATVCAAGCAKSDFEVARQTRVNMRPGREATLANAPEEKPPKILPETHFAAGLLFERQGQVDNAILQYRKAVALNHNYVAAFHRLGLLLGVTGQHLDAARSLQSAVALRPDNAVLRNSLGFEWMLVQQWDDAERELRTAIELQPELASAHINLGLVLAKARRFGESLASFQAVLPDADAYYNLGLMFRGQQMYTEAADAFRKVLTINPDFSAAKVQLQQMTARTERQTPAEALAEAPQPDMVQLAFPQAGQQEPVAELEMPRNADLLAEGEATLQPTHEPGTSLPDLTVLLAILAEVTEKDCDIAGERPGVAERSVEDAEQDSPTLVVGAVFLDPPFAEETSLPPADAPMQNMIEAFENEPVMGLAAESEARLMVADPSDQAVPCDPESGELDADEVIAASSVEAAAAPTAVRDAWAMVEELEARVALRRYEDQTHSPENGDFPEAALTPDALAGPPALTEKDLAGFDDDESVLAGDAQIDDFDEALTEFGDEDAADADDPHVSRDTTVEEPCDEPAHGEGIVLWSAEFGELSALLSIVRNETACWNEMDAQDGDLLASGQTRRSCLEAAEQAALLSPEGPLPPTSNESGNPTDRTVEEPVVVWPADPSGEVLATQPHSLDPLPN